MQYSKNHQTHRTYGLRNRKKRPVALIYNIFVAITVGLFTACVLWYNAQLSPVSTSKSTVDYQVKSGSSLGQIADGLKEAKIIRSSTAFKIYVRLSNKQSLIKSGVYSLSSSESTRQIVDHLVNGSVDVINITFYPGATLSPSQNSTNNGHDDVTSVLLAAGYSESEILAALSAAYDSPLFAGKPSTADLEGYIFGETYQFNKGTPVSDILQRAFTEFYSKVEKYNLVAKFASHGLSLYQGITLASIVQREVSDANYQKQVAQVFYNRLSQVMTLGSDVTYQYIADKLGVARDVNIDSPYNTRRYAGLPPGPISAPGLSALLAVAEPASGDYLFFLSGDDDLMYFANTEEEHERNRTTHCIVKCSIP